jgi:hypothetical protein
MLRRGVSLPGVGAVLRHQSPATTAHYAKVDLPLLSEIAHPHEAAGDQGGVATANAPAAPRNG